MRSAGIIKPNLWITGLPKAGTSSLFSMLAQHPLVAGSHPKETFFLLDQNSVLLNQRRNFWRNGMDGWSEFMTSQNVQHARYFLEGTTHLFFQERCLQTLKDFHDDSRFIVMLREPSERIYSSFVYTRDTLLRMPRDITFNRYVSDLLSGASLDYVHDSVSQYVLTRELEYSNYAGYLARWYANFPSKDIFVGLFEEFVADHKSFMKRVFTFLDLQDIDAVEQHSNPSRTFKHAGLHKTLRRSAKLVPFPGVLKTALKQFYYKNFADKVGPVSEEDRVARRKLKEYFAPCNVELRNRFNIDISRWNA